MASPQLFLSLTKNFFQRNNPVETVVMGVVQSVYNLITFQSRMKLLKYRYMLEAQKLERIETTLNQFNPYEMRGNKMSRTF
ncbi:hypothetical protein [Vampirovibrio sp.]|uniref:hypothetical protein n=1 Tax=Vampirovibrio sp. TaxID=2717857 RepID=UPI003593964F